MLLLTYYAGNYASIIGASLGGNLLAALSYLYSVHITYIHIEALLYQEIRRWIAVIPGKLS